VLGHSILVVTFGLVQYFGFWLAGIFSSRVVISYQGALIQNGTCGRIILTSAQDYVQNGTSFTETNSAFFMDHIKISSRSLRYAERCYGETPATDICNKYTQPSFGWTYRDSSLEYPFQDMCSDTIHGIVQLESQLISSDTDLGIFTDTSI
jgi:ABC-type proline/glycine betaine transport system ATPase subunit